MWNGARQGSGDIRGCGQGNSYGGCSVARQEEDHAGGRLKASGVHGSPREQVVVVVVVEGE